jgi:hypothetical protein
MISLTTITRIMPMSGRLRLVNVGIHCPRVSAVRSSRATRAESIFAAIFLVVIVAPPNTCSLMSSVIFLIWSET